jgi:hypothetical protein
MVRDMTHPGRNRLKVFFTLSVSTVTVPLTKVLTFKVGNR